MDRLVLKGLLTSKRRTIFSSAGHPQSPEHRGVPDQKRPRLPPSGTNESGSRGPGGNGGNTSDDIIVLDDESDAEDSAGSSQHSASRAPPNGESMTPAGKPPALGAASPRGRLGTINHMFQGGDNSSVIFGVRPQCGLAVPDLAPAPTPRAHEQKQGDEQGQKQWQQQALASVYYGPPVPPVVLPRAPLLADTGDASNDSLPSLFDASSPYADDGLDDGDCAPPLEPLPPLSQPQQESLQAERLLPLQAPLSQDAPPPLEAPEQEPPAQDALLLPLLEVSPTVAAAPAAAAASVQEAPPPRGEMPLHEAPPREAPLLDAAAPLVAPTESLEKLAAPAPTPYTPDPASGSMRSVHAQQVQMLIDAVAQSQAQVFELHTQMQKLTAHHAVVAAELGQKIDARDCQIKILQEHAQLQARLQSNLCGQFHHQNQTVLALYTRVENEAKQNTVQVAELRDAIAWALKQHTELERTVGLLRQQQHDQQRLHERQLQRKRRELLRVRREHLLLRQQHCQYLEQHLQRQSNQQRGAVQQRQQQQQQLPESPQQEPPVQQQRQQHQQQQRLATDTARSEQQPQGGPILELLVLPPGLELAIAAPQPWSGIEKATDDALSQTGAMIQKAPTQVNAAQEQPQKQTQKQTPKLAVAHAHPSTLTWQTGTAQAQTPQQAGASPDFLRMMEAVRARASTPASAPAQANAQVRAPMSAQPRVQSHVQSQPQPPAPVQPPAQLQTQSQQQPIASWRAPLETSPRTSTPAVSNDVGGHLSGDSRPTASSAACSLPAASSRARSPPERAPPSHPPPIALSCAGLPMPSISSFGLAGLPPVGSLFHP